MKVLKVLKEKLQFTGWLQYILTGVVGTVFLLLALVVWFLSHLLVAAPLFFVAFFFYSAMVIDIITIKYKRHPKEKLPNRNEGTDLFDLMRVRKSCRSFQLRKLRIDDKDELMRHVDLEMNKINMDTDKKDCVRFEYVHEPLTVWPVVNASEFVVAIAPKEYSRTSIINVGRSLQKVVIHATRMGLGTCWIGPGADQTSIMKQMGDKFDDKKDHIVCVCAVGYASKYIPLSIRLMSKSQKRRLPLTELFFIDLQESEPLDLNTNNWERFGRCYEICQWAPSSFNGQTTRAIASVTETGNSEVDFYCTSESRFYGPLALGIWCGNWELGSKALGIEGEVVHVPADIMTDETSLRCYYGIGWISN